ncbi:MAG: nucleotidyltransferase family protein [Anaerolineae bacterium]|nr:nucleotidyltransferase family protein [Anaerolineae bacterium]
MKTVILAGGLGKRLRPAVADRPKPMAEIADQPFLLYQIAQLRASGLCEIVLCVGYRAAQITSYLGDGTRWGVSIAYAIEETPLGTAGAIRNAGPHIDGTFLAMNGDSYVDADLHELVAAHRQQRASARRTVGTLLRTYVDDAASYGTLEVDAHGWVTHFAEKAARARGWINAGVYVLEPEILDLIPPDRAVSLEREVFPDLLQSGYRLFSHATAGYFVDIGTPEGYARFQAYVAARGPTDSEEKRP